jgi:hypothetical protein
LIVMITMHALKIAVANKLELVNMNKLNATIIMLVPLILVMLLVDVNMKLLFVHQLHVKFHLAIPLMDVNINL